MRGRTILALSFGAACSLGALSHSGAQAADEGEIEVSGSVEGLSGGCPNLRFRVGALAVSTDARTEFDDGSCADVKNGGRVEVEGRQAPDGGVLAREVDLRVGPR